MAANQYTGVGGVARKVKSQYIGVGGVARKIKQGFVGVGGVARKCYAGERTIVLERSEVSPDSAGVLLFGETVPKFTKVTGWIWITERNRPIEGSMGNTFTVPWGTGENPVYFSLTSVNGESAYDFHEYSSYDGEVVECVDLRFTVFRDRIEAYFRVDWYDEGAGRTYISDCPLDGDTDFSLTFVCEGD